MEEASILQYYIPHKTDPSPAIAPYLRTMNDTEPDPVTAKKPKQRCSHHSFLSLSGCLLISAHSLSAQFQSYNEKV